MLILKVVLLSALAAAPAAAQEAGRITVTGEGRVAAAPDMATVMLGVTAEAANAKEAMDRVSVSVDALLASLAAAGIEGRDIQTTGLSLNPIWDGSASSSGTPRIEGFVASNGVTVRVRALDGLGEVLDGALEAGGNTFNGLSFGLQDPQPRLDEARAAAVADARRKADLLAGAAGVSLGRVVSIAEGGGMAPPQPMFRMEAAMASDAVPVAEGEVDVTAQVTIVWEIAQ